MTAYYNEIDPYAAQWLRNLIAAGHIAPGDVDTRSIEDVHPDDLKPYTQCHFFAGIGIWSAGLRRVGWPDDRPVWTGSCPCQPFSAAGKGGGFDDERHLWPAFFHLITARRPERIVGEQVASKDGLAWLDLVQADLEGADYAVGAVDTCSAGFGAPHWRQRLWWVADPNDQRKESAGNGTRARDARPASVSSPLGNALGVGLANTQGERGRTGLCDSEPAGCGEPFARDGGSIIDMDNAATTRCVGEIPDAESDSWDQTRLRVPDVGRGPSDLAHASIGRRGILGPPGGPRRGGHSDGRVELNGLGVAAIAGPQGEPDGRDALFGTERETTQRASGQPDSRLADAERHEQRGGGRPRGESATWPESGVEPGGRSDLGGLGDTDGERTGRDGGTILGAQSGLGGGVRGELDGAAVPDGIGGLALTDDTERWPDGARGHDIDGAQAGWLQGPGDAEGRGAPGGPGPVNGFWRNSDWLFCRDGKWRPVGPSTFPLVNGAPARMGRLRAYGNGLNLEATVGFLLAADAAIMELDETVRLGDE